MQEPEERGLRQTARKNTADETTFNVEREAGYSGARKRSSRFSFFDDRSGSGR